LSAELNHTKNRDFHTNHPFTSSLFKSHAHNGNAIACGLGVV
jgi:hypothetical protein